MPMATRNPGDSIAAAHQNAIVDALKGTVGENLTVFFKGADRTSAAALVLGTDGNYFDVTGTVTITSISTLPAGTVIKLQFDGVLLLTHNATTLILSGGANYTTAAGDVFEFISEGSGNWREAGRSLSAITAAVGSTSYSVASQFGATPSLTFGTTNTAGTGTAFVRRNAQIALYDTTVARAVTFGDVGTVGSSGGFAAHVLHGHPFAVGAAIVASTGNVLQVASTNGNLSWAASGTSAHGPSLHNDRTREMYIPAPAWGQDSGTGGTVLANQTTANQMEYISWLLDAAASEAVVSSFLVPTDWTSGALTYKIYWAMDSATSGNVVVRIRARAVQTAEAVDDTPDMTADDTYSVPATIETLKVSTFSATHTVATGDLVSIRLARLGSDAGDTATGDMHFIGLGVSYTADE